jgi:hypothetical protein
MLDVRKKKTSRSPSLRMTDFKRAADAALPRDGTHVPCARATAERGTPFGVTGANFSDSL